MTSTRKQLVVLAGGMGTRLTSAGIQTPKLLLKFQNQTLLENILNEAHGEGFTDILWLLGHGSEDIERQISQAANLSEKIKHKIFIEDNHLGTLGALLQARDYLHEDFCVIMGDLFLASTNIGGVYQDFIKSSEDARILVKYTDHPSDSDLVIVDNEIKVIDLKPYPHTVLPTLPIGNAGVIFIRKSYISEDFELLKQDIFKDLIPIMLNKGCDIKATFHQGVIKDIGTPQRLSETNTNAVPDKHLSDEKGIFFDRDGTLNVENGHINSKDQIELLPETSKILAAAVKNYNKIGVLTNQPVIARGDATLEQVKDINLHLVNMAGIYDSSKVEFKVCPHYPESGFAGEVLELKIVCNCRKPACGMILQTLNENQLRSNNCLYVGNSVTDLQAAEAANVKWVHLISATQSACNLHPDLISGKCMKPRELIKFLKSEGERNVD